MWETSSRASFNPRFHNSDEYLAFGGTPANVGSCTGGGGTVGNEPAAAIALVLRAVDGNVSGPRPDGTQFDYMFSNGDPFTFDAAYSAPSDTYTGDITFTPSANDTAQASSCCGGGSAPSTWTFTLSPLTAYLTTTNPDGYPANGTNDSTAIEADQNGNPVNGNFFVRLNGPAEGAVNVPIYVDQTMPNAATGERGPD